MPPTLLIEDRGPIRTLTLNRPERRNALTPELQQALVDALEAGAGCSHLRLLILTGAGQSFCAGLDLASLQAMQGQSPAEIDADTERIAKMFHTLYQCPIPTIAAVNGHAVAGGAGLATSIAPGEPTRSFARLPTSRKASLPFLRNESPYGPHPEQPRLLAALGLSRKLAG